MSCPVAGEASVLVKVNDEPIFILFRGCTRFKKARLPMHCRALIGRRGL